MSSYVRTIISYTHLPFKKTMPELSAAQKKFPNIYAKLSPTQQNLLKMLSVIYAKVSRTNLVKCLEKAGLKNDKGKAFISSDLKPILDTLKKHKLVRFTKDGVQCQAEVVELATRQAIHDQSFEAMAMAVTGVIPTKEPWSMEPSFKSFDLGVRDIRIAVYRRRNMDTIRKIVYEVYHQHRSDFNENNPYRLIFFTPPDRDLLFSFPVEFVEYIFNLLLDASLLTLQPASDVFSLFTDYCRSTGNISEHLIHLLLQQYIFRGNHDEARLVLKKLPGTAGSYSYKGFFSFIGGKLPEAIKAYRRGLELLRKKSGKKNVFYTNAAGLFYPLALLQSVDTADIQEALSYLNTIKKQRGAVGFRTAHEDIRQTVLLALGRKKPAGKIAHSIFHHFYADYLSVFISYLTLYWQGKADDAVYDNDIYLESLFHLAEKAGYFWLAGEAAALLVKFGLDNALTPKQRQKLLDKFPSAGSIVEKIHRREQWEQVLSSLIDLKGTGEEQGKTQQKSRLVWLIDHEEEEEYEEYKLIPKLQKLNKNGSWTKGRAVALKTLAEEREALDYLTSQDRQIVAAIEKKYAPRSYYSSYTQSTYEFDMTRALTALVGHPLLAWQQSPTVHVELVDGPPELHVEKTENGFVVSLQPPLDDEAGFTLVSESPTRLKLVTVTSEYKQIAEILATSILVPERAKDMVLKAVAAVTPLMTVQSDIGGGSENAKEVEADQGLYIHVVPYGEGLKVEFLCKPFRDGGSFYHPGSGGRVVLAEIDGRQLQTTRDLGQELKKEEDFIGRSQVLQRRDTSLHECLVEEPEECLELLSELHALKDQVTVQWPQGESLRVSAPVSSNRLSLRISRDNEWFAASGSLRVDDDLVINMKKLLEMSAMAGSRFIELDEGKFLALTREFKRRLDELRAFSENHKEGVRFNPLAGLALQDFTGEVGEFSSDQHWKNNIKRFQPVEPELPTTLQARLRDYQLQGFNWLACLSSWGVGACLADDMGLGKTVQALAAVLLRAPDGPTLVVAPTSVMMNWQEEANRFAPTLNVLWFGEGDRQKMLAGLEPFDLVICSYGLLQIEGEKLAGVKWQTVIIDEAQAIKNMATKRSKAAMNLQAGFRVITTGTPIENHLGELWNLFRFINPGLLGSLKSFSEKFAVPIEKLKDKQARNRLKKLIRPFILRRLKQDVLQELPPRTEITMQVEMSPEEAAIYEAQRRQALETLAEVDENQGSKPMRILAEITRLRRFCCNPDLVLPEAKIAGSKLKVFGQVVAELLENNHKALVFSQFVGHLAIIRDYLAGKKISYQYLDGSTPVKERNKRVKEFQAGKGSIFLISLKAGGAGLNLTAADYVIHMDPWWNPAVEDQASDRAHRIGQQRPVTVYRLVVKNSIEEKIVALHQHKRDLADNLLEGSDMSGRVSTAELLELLKSGG